MVSEVKEEEFVTVEESLCSWSRDTHLIIFFKLLFSEYGVGRGWSTIHGL